ncbi:MAG: hypothetical protein MUO91_02705 [candidate division Zixibacteria bacterium]|nr:hypothetical protein [candidate division Zixibacteria bacterium]
MKDTIPQISVQFNKMMMTLSGEERFRMGFSMNEDSRRLVIASLLNQKPEATSAEKRLLLFDRFYGKEFDQKTREKILKVLLRRTETE